MAGMAEMDWSRFLGRPVVAADPDLAKAAVEGSSVLITGAGGSIGSRLAIAAIAGRPKKLVLLDVSESALYEALRRLAKLPDAGQVEVVPVTGSVCDSGLIEHLLAAARPEVIFHAAAYKHVPLMEQNPFQAIANNSIGTYRLVRASAGAGVSRFLMISTDKAVNPRSVMGVSKRIAELVVLTHANEISGDEKRMNVIRLCNVLDSSGSVSTVFAEQAAQGAALTVTDAEAARYFISPQEAERAILEAATAELHGRVLVPECGKEFRILEMARFVARGQGVADPEIQFTGLRAGDKLREELWSREETVEAVLAGGLRVMASSAQKACAFAAAMERLEAAVAGYDQAELQQAIAELVPAYESPGSPSHSSPKAGLEWGTETDVAPKKDVAK